MQTGTIPLGSRATVNIQILYEKHLTFMSVTSRPTRYVTDDAGNRVAVILDLEQYEALTEAAEELDAIRAYDEAKAANDEAIPFEQAIREIGRSTTQPAS